MIYATIMAGGSGTRFWPLSRQHHPKQFLRLFGDRTLLQQTWDRLEGLLPPEQILVITNQAHAEQTHSQLPELLPERLLGEPMGRDTAPCIGLAAALLVREDPNATMLVLAADHLIEPVENFHAALQAAVDFVELHPTALVTFGVPPTFPATGYGYLQRVPEVAQPAVGIRPAIYPLLQFREKPSRESARDYLARGDYCWNSGIFCWKAATILDYLHRLQPYLMAVLEKIAVAWPTAWRTETLVREFPNATKISIDYAVMEHAQPIYMVEAGFRWDDVGSWLALERVFPSDPEGNVAPGRSFTVDSHRCVLVSQNQDHLLATLGVDDLIVVHTPQVTLVAHRSREQQIKQLLDRLREANLDDLL